MTSGFSSPLATKTPDCAKDFWLDSHSSERTAAPELTTLQQARSRLNVCERKDLHACIVDCLARRRDLVRDHGLDAPIAPPAHQQISADQDVEGAAADLSCPHSTLLISTRELALEAATRVCVGRMGRHNVLDAITNRTIVLEIIGLPLCRTASVNTSCLRLSQHTEAMACVSCSMSSG